jgi:signal transduction histidine kinase/CheY-like chemotaxis protein
MHALSDPKVLIVDDNHGTVEMLERLFKINKFEVIKAYNGSDAIALARHEQPDLIILDVMMPRMNGFEVLRALRQDPLTENIPTIFLTAKDSPADIEHGIQLGADDYIPKPAESRELIARSRSKIEAKRYRDALARKTRDLQQLLDLSMLLNTPCDLPSMVKLITKSILQLRQTKAVALLYKSYADTLYETTAPEIPVLSLLSLEAVFQSLSTSQQAYLETMDSNTSAAFAYALYKDSKTCGVLMIVCSPAHRDELHALYTNAAQQCSLALDNGSSFQLRQNYALELERTVNKRTEELKSTQQLLIRSEKLASVGRLASAIAHEINNPLMPILLNLELMVEDLQKGQPIQLTDVDILVTYQHAVRIKRTLERFLQFTRSGRKGQDAMHPVHLNKLLDNLIALSRRLFEQASVKILHSFDENVQPIMGNSDQLEQVFLNMMINARDAMPKGGTLYITTQAKSNSVQVRIRDTGIGIPEEFMSRLFEPFSSNREKGSGLGLFVSYEIVRNHQGTISVSSKVNEGTEFVVELPTGY